MIIFRMVIEVSINRDVMKYINNNGKDLVIDIHQFVSKERDRVERYLFIRHDIGGCADEIEDIKAELSYIHEVIGEPQTPDEEDLYSEVEEMKSTMDNVTLIILEIMKSNASQFEEMRDKMYMCIAQLEKASKSISNYSNKFEGKLMSAVTNVELSLKTYIKKIQYQLDVGDEASDNSEQQRMLSKVEEFGSNINVSVNSVRASDYVNPIQDSVKKCIEILSQPSIEEDDCDALDVYANRLDVDIEEAIDWSATWR